MMTDEQLNFVKGLTEVIYEDYYGAHDEAEAIINYIRKHSANVLVSGNEANQSENKKDGEVAVVFAELKIWLEKEKDKYDTPKSDNPQTEANSWGYYKAYENVLFKIDELKAKATDR